MDSQNLCASRYTDGEAPPPLVLQLPSSLPEPPPCAVYLPQTEAEFDVLAQRLPVSFLVYVARDVPPNHIQELGRVNETTRVPVVVLDTKLMPQIPLGFGGRDRFIGKMYKHKLLRFLECEQTFKNVCSFATSDRKWRGTSLHD